MRMTPLWPAIDRPQVPSTIVFSKTARGWGPRTTVFSTVALRPNRRGLGIG